MLGFNAFVLLLDFADLLGFVDLLEFFDFVVLLNFRDFVDFGVLLDFGDFIDCLDFEETGSLDFGDSLILGLAPSSNATDSMNPSQP